MEVRGNLIYCCEEHVELALDVMVDDCEKAPKLEKLPNREISTGCEYCQKTAIYVVANE